MFVRSHSQDFRNSEGSNEESAGDAPDQFLLDVVPGLVLDLVLEDQQGGGCDGDASLRLGL